MKYTVYKHDENIAARYVAGFFEKANSTNNARIVLPRDYLNWCILSFVLKRICIRHQIVYLFCSNNFLFFYFLLQLFQVLLKNLSCVHDIKPWCCFKFVIVRYWDILNCHFDVMYDCIKTFACLLFTWTNRVIGFPVLRKVQIVRVHT